MELVIALSLAICIPDDGGRDDARKKKKSEEESQRHYSSAERRRGGRRSVSAGEPEAGSVIETEGFEHIIIR